MKNIVKSRPPPPTETRRYSSGSQICLSLVAADSVMWRVAYRVGTLWANKRRNIFLKNWFSGQHFSSGNFYLQNSQKTREIGRQRNWVVSPWYCELKNGGQLTGAKFGHDFAPPGVGWAGGGGAPCWLLLCSCFSIAVRILVSRNRWRRVQAKMIWKRGWKLYISVFS